ncbi:uncharacterized protein LOC116768040 [Danaus plexippus]|uniref:uncharacterized protein LOC116768040 n=1 Tax=Danaus plexippus TaxID=13037 RepID=UPI0013C3F45E|nr:uncharacterized protein LOC116768040 [Danaus plexippus]
MKVFFLFFLSILMVTMCHNTNSTEQCPNVKSSLNLLRKRRHLTFPDKSNIVLTISLVKAFLTHAPAGWNLALEIDVLFPLPDAKFSNKHWRKKLHHRQKREFWERLQNAFNLHNLNGKACVLKSICDAKIYLAEPGKSLVHDLLRAIFTAPVHQEDFTNEMTDQYREILDPDFCQQPMDCPFSLLNFIFALNKQIY